MESLDTLRIGLIVWGFVGLLFTLFVLATAPRMARQSGAVLEKHPLAWVPLILACLFCGLPAVVLLVVGALVAPFFGVLQWLGYRLHAKTGARARFHDHGIEIFNQKGTIQRLVAWDAIERGESAFLAPIFISRLVLRDGEVVDLHYVDEDELIAALAEHGIGFEEDP